MIFPLGQSQSLPESRRFVTRAARCVRCRTFDDRLQHSESRALSNWPPVVTQSATETLESSSPLLSPAAATMTGPIIAEWSGQDTFENSARRGCSRPPDIRPITDLFGSGLAQVATLLGK